MKDARTSIIGILLTVIFSLVAFSVHREVDRLDRSIEVLHMRVSANIKTKADKEDMQRELNHVWKSIADLKKRKANRVEK